MLLTYFVLSADNDKFLNTNTKMQPIFRNMAAKVDKSTVSSGKRDWDSAESTCGTVRLKVSMLINILHLML